MLRATQLSGFGSGPVPASSVLDKPSPPDFAWKFDEFQITSTGNTELPATLGSVDLYGVGGYQNNGIFVGSVDGGSGNVVQLTSASRYVKNITALGLSGDLTWSGWVKVVDSGTGAGTFHVFKLQAASSGAYSVSLELRKNSSNLLEADLSVDGTVETFAIGGALNQWHHVVVRVTSGAVDLVFNGSEFDHGTTVNTFTTVDYFWASSSSSFSSPQALYLDEYYIWNSSLTDAELGYIHNGGAGRHLDASTGDFAGATVVPDPDHAWIVGSDVLEDVAGGQDLTHTNTLLTGSYSRNGNSLKNDGSYDWTAPVSFDLSGSGTDYSISYWARWDGLSTGDTYYPVEVRFASTTCYLKGSRIDSGDDLNRVQLDFYDSSSLDGITQTDQATWVHVVITHSGTQLKLYLNGELVKTNSGATAVGASDVVNVSAGSVSLSFTESASSSATIDELYFFRSALTQTQAAALYNNGTGKFVNSSGKF